MPRRLNREQSEQVWKALEHWLTRFEGGPRETARGEGTWQYDFNAYPALFPDRVVVTADCVPDELLLGRIKKAMERIGDHSVYFLAKEYAEGDEIRGLDWEIPLQELSRRTLSEISPGFESYLYSATDAWAVYFHHEGFAFCGGVPEFVEILKVDCERHPLDSL